MTTESPSLKVRQRLPHPVIDADGHLIEHVPTFMAYLRRVGGPRIADAFERASAESAWYAATQRERFERALHRPSWWSFPARNTLDRATAMFPALLRARMDELGLDFLIVYSTMGIFLPRIANDEVRQASCRALNVMLADLFGEFSDRMTPVAAIPMHSPAEAVDELSYVVGELGFKAAHVESRIFRPIPAASDKAPDLAGYATWYDHVAFESAFDYDPVWAKCAELRIAPGTHSDGVWGSRMTNNFVYNHLGSFAAAGEAFCKSLLLGGVTRRFPTLNFAFLEGGVAWACELYNGLVSRAEKRNRDTIRNYDPDEVDVAMMDDYATRYGQSLTRVGDQFVVFDPLASPNAAAMAGYRDNTENVDEFACCGVERPEDLRPLFEPCFYFGCEADDRLAALAFDTRINPFGARLKAMFSSDNGHWDVLDMRNTLAEAYELVEDALLDDDDFRDFTFANSAMLFARVNPAFFAGTVIESDVAALLAEQTSSPE